ncbi:hypothetical protein FF1_039808 [Malus domestica]
MAENQTTADEKEKTLQEDIKKLESKIQEQENRINQLQSTGFQFLNFYFIFQGVIFTAIANGTSALTHSDRWIPLTLSLSAAIINLFSLVVIGGKYNRILAEREQSWGDCLGLYKELLELDTPNQGDAATSKLEQKRKLLDPFASSIRTLCFLLCMVVCVAVAIIMCVACLKIRRKK